MEKTYYSNMPGPPLTREQWLDAIQRTVDMLNHPPSRWYVQREIVPPELMADYDPPCDCGSEEKGGGGHYTWCKRNLIR